MQRRQFIKLTASAGLGASIAPSLAALAAAERPSAVAMPTDFLTIENNHQTWLGRDFWANRLQDWQANNGRIECVQSDESYEVRTVSLLTRELTDAHKPARIRVTVGALHPGKAGFCGLLLGVGAGQLDYRASALAQRFSGVGGGFMATLNSQGELGFQDFSEAKNTLVFESLTRPGASPIGELGDRAVVLDCHIDPVADDRFDIRLIALDAKTEREIGFAVRTDVAPDELMGGIMLVSSTPAKQPGTGWWFKDIATAGDKILAEPSRAEGPVLGCLYSLNQRVMKLTAQFFPLNTDAHPNAQLQLKSASGEWQTRAVAAIEDGFVARFRADDWDASQAVDYRIVIPDATQYPAFTGQFRQDKASPDELKVGLYSCIIPTAKSLDEGHYKKLIPEERELGRYTPDNIFFPHNELVSNSATHDPDLCLFVGDQYYETYPTRYGRDTPQAKLDTLYRWYLWLWTFRDMARSRPSIVLVDDHDVLQGNLWGQAGVSGGPKEEDGGFKWDLDLVRMVYRVQCSHNPDAYDPTPINGCIPVYYGSFVYGGVNFAFVEDRKFKTAPDYDPDPETTRGVLLGARQEQFLENWANSRPGMPKAIITASMWGSPQTDEKGEPLLDYDANGYPPDGRRRAIALAKKAQAVVLSGDQHLGMLAEQCLDSFDDGVLFFSGPASAAFWQRWFEPAKALDNQRNNDPNTGNFVDTFGNKMRVLAVANPKISHADFQDDNTTWGKFLADRQLKSEGYGLVRFRPGKGEVTFECWPWDADPSRDPQFSGWPYRYKY
ncbi:alkaline phosphatase D family protein [Gilvimarinus chinensis]|uniref:alkaline phosphatase D family protein n=1 Tax=Gilvimarinus chinensis TaxID=396005 RepID=UPI00035C8A22|nr:alkaline phosphatase D family protein [Gilvimarinus chinensis]